MKIKYINSDDLNKMPKYYRASFINSLSGCKSALLVGTKQASGQLNLALFNSIVHIGANPPLLGLISRPDTVRRDTLDAIKYRGDYTLNHVTPEFYKQAHDTSARTTQSEFDLTGLTPYYSPDFGAPFVAESPLKIGLKLRRLIPIPENGTHFIIGEIQHVILPDTAILETGDIALDALNSVAVTGLNTYHTLSKLGYLPYAHAR